MRKGEKGFTLVELIVVIAIIAVLAGVLLVAINPASILMRSRDTRRMEDLDALNKAIQLALADGEITLAATDTCTTCTSTSGTQAVDGTGWVMYTPITGKTGLSKYIPSLPVDPLHPATTNVYTYISDGTDYEINAVLESTDNATKMTVDGGDSDTALEVGTALDL